MGDNILYNNSGPSSDEKHFKCFPKQKSRFLQIFASPTFYICMPSVPSINSAPKQIGGMAFQGLSSYQ